MARQRRGWVCPLPSPDAQASPWRSVSAMVPQCHVRDALDRWAILDAARVHGRLSGWLTDCRGARQRQENSAIVAAARASGLAASGCPWAAPGHSTVRGCGYGAAEGERRTESEGGRLRRLGGSQGGISWARFSPCAPSPRRKAGPVGSPGPRQPVQKRPPRTSCRSCRP